jgi:DNA-binding transcriptional ArsR family regulator
LTIRNEGAIQRHWTVRRRLAVPQDGPTAPKLLYIAKDDAELRRLVLQETRALLLDALKRPRADGKPGYTIQELARKLGFTAQNIHHHLKLLEEKGLARVAAEEPTHGLHRQFWVTDVEHVYTDMAPEAKAALAMDKAQAHHAPAQAEEAYFERHFEAMAALGARVPREERAQLMEFYRRESALFGRAFQRLQPRLGQAAQRWGVGEAKSALHFAAIASFSDAEFEAWVEGLRRLRDAAKEPEGLVVGGWQA